MIEPATVDTDGGRSPVTHIACCAAPTTLCGLDKSGGRFVDRDGDCVVCDDLARDATCLLGTCPKDD